VVRFLLESSACPSSVCNLDVTERQKSIPRKVEGEENALKRKVPLGMEIFNIKVLIPKKNIVIFCNYIWLQEPLGKPPAPIKKHWSILDLPTQTWLRPKLLNRV